MQERVINISSINRQKIGRSHPEDFNNNNNNNNNNRIFIQDNPSV